MLTICILHMLPLESKRNMQETLCFIPPIAKNHLQKLNFQHLDAVTYLDNFAF